MTKTIKRFGFLALLWALATGFAFAQEPDQTLRLTASQPSFVLTAPARWWIDESAHMSIDEMEAASPRMPWRARALGEQYNIDGKAWWMQFTAQVETPSRWFLEIASSGLDRAQLFYRDASGKWVVQEAGDSRAVSAWPIPGRVPTFDLSPEMGKAVTYYLRIEHARVDFAVPIRLYRHGELLAARELEQFMLGAYFGLCMLMALVAVGNAVAYRDRGFAAYAVYVTSLGLGQAAYLGVGAQHLWDSALKWNEIAAYLLPGLSSAAGLWFVKIVAEPARYSRALDLAVWSLILAVLSAVALDTFLTSRASFGLQMSLTALSLLVIVGLIAMVWIQGEDPHIRLIALGFLPVVVMAIFPVLRGLNLIPNSALTRYGVTIGAMLEMPILFYALTLRVHRRRESEVRAAALARSDALTGLAHARTLLQRMETAIARARSLRHPCALIGVRIVNMDAIVAEFGRECMEKTLVVSASHMRRAIADIDLAARVGDLEFALLIEGPTTAAAVLSRAQHVIASGLRQSPGLPPGLIIKFHVVAAMLPEADLDAPQSLDWVLGGLAHMPADARKMIRPLNF